jgi:large subunit ribosomal protein L5
MIRLKEKYEKEVIPKMKEKFGYKNNLAVPRIEKVVVNIGFGRETAAKTSEERNKFCSSVLEDLTSITGQKGVLRNAKKSISAFKIRQGMPIGGIITLRKRKMYDFLERLIHIALPRSRDFQGIDIKSFDEKGNLTIGLKEHIVFPEVSPERSKQIFGFEITVVTTAETKEEGIEFLRLLGFPIKKSNETLPDNTLKNG